MSLAAVLRALEKHRRSVQIPYFVPGLWVNSGTDPRQVAAVRVNPYDFYAGILSTLAIKAPQPLIQGAGGEWSKHAIVYSLFPRLSTAFDHDGDEQIRIGANDEGWRETGTLLKSMALLPYIREMGFNTIHLLPITAIGRDGMKGNLARRMPSAIRMNWMKIWMNLLALGVNVLFVGFVRGRPPLRDACCG